MMASDDWETGKITCVWTRDGALLSIVLTPRRAVRTTTMIFGAGLASIEPYDNGDGMRTLVHFVGTRQPMHVMEFYEDVCAALRRGLV